MVLKISELKILPCMMPAKLYETICTALSAERGHPVSRFHYRPASGGSINQCYRIECEAGVFFCKANDAKKFPGLFEKELLGLQLLAAQKAIAVVRPIACAVEEEWQVLLLEWLEQGTPDPSFWKKFGAQLALLHRQSYIAFGLPYDNYMGSVPQHNDPAPEWRHFFTTQRLQPLVKQCAEKGLLDTAQQKLFDVLYPRIPAFFTDNEPPALLHGDLWSGNFLCGQANEPCLIDPAVYYGHRSVDLAMTTLFGGFDAAFYEAYHHHYPLPSHYREQWKLCNLYPLLIHLLLFGKSYSRSIDQTLGEFA